MHGHEHELLRGANTDINTTLAIALISFVFVLYYGLKMAGRGFIRQYLNFGPFFRGVGQIFKGKFNLMDIFSGAIDIFVGFLELLSLLIRNISFTFRLFGNMTAGEILILIVAFLLPLASVSWMVYGLELLIGFVQALIFAGLTLVFVTMAVTPHEAESH
jgi:F-type H+-transporting ATPase subunit a